MRSPATAMTASTTSPSVDTELFRTVMASLASGVSVVATYDEEDQPRGLTCSAVCSVSLEPPLLLASVSNRSGTLRAVLERGLFSVSILSAQGQTVSQLFASPAADKFERVRWTAGPVTGIPLMPATIGHAECAVHDAVEAGDHTLLIGRVVGGGSAQEHLPLTYWRGGYARLLPDAV
ncbi:flavin reductase family protein [Streptomyces sp. CWNU-52B]|uniref:flavin reductase family protein n=1 Tax=unclassified Streptomyces TaxID=2593676 RepID=UPI0039C4D194